MVSILILGAAAAEFGRLCHLIESFLPIRDFSIANVQELSVLAVGNTVLHDLALVVRTTVRRPRDEYRLFSTIPAKLVAVLLDGRERETIEPTSGNSRAVIRIRASTPRITQLLRHTPELLRMLRPGGGEIPTQALSKYLTTNRKAS